MNKNNQMILNESDIVSCWLSDNDVSEAIFTNVEPINIYNDWCKNYDLDELVIKASEESTDNRYIEKCLSNWYMPDEYKNFDIVNYLLDLTKTDVEKTRVLEELNLYKEREMLIILKFLRYLVDMCNENDIVLGVGRGSSVASYCLYLLGVHRVDSIKYDLDIKEFLK